MPETYENQKTITIKGAQHDEKNIYAKLNIEAMKTACLMLKPNTFKVWCYVAKNQNNYTFALSCIETCKFCNMSKPTYLQCIRELIKVGYLQNTKGSHYNFYEMLPDEALQITVKKD